MSKYSEFFLVGSPEYEQIGDKLRLRKYGSWLAEEAWLREKQNQKRAQFTLQTIQLARRIAKEKGIEQEDVFQLLQSDSPERAEVFSEYSEDTSRLMTYLPSGREQFEDLVTLFFRNRGEVNVGKKWQATEDWGKEDTNKLPEAYLRQIEAFMSAEEGRRDDDGEGAEEDESEKKQP
jgi:hypothetical protein